MLKGLYNVIVYRYSDGLTTAFPHYLSKGTSVLNASGFGRGSLKIPNKLQKKGLEYMTTWLAWLQQGSGRGALDPLHASIDVIVLSFMYMLTHQ